MGQMKQWGLKLMNRLTEIYLTGLSLQVSVEHLTDELMESGEFKDRSWVHQQVQAVADHPAMFGHANNYWWALRHRKVRDEDR